MIWLLLSKCFWLAHHNNWFRLITWSRIISQLNLPVTTSRVVTSLHSTRYNDAVLVFLRQVLGFGKHFFKLSSSLRNPEEWSNCLQFLFWVFKYTGHSEQDLKHIFVTITVMAAYHCSLWCSKKLLVKHYDFTLCYVAFEFVYWALTYSLAGLLPGGEGTHVSIWMLGFYSRGGPNLLYQRTIGFCCKGGWDSRGGPNLLDQEC
jgi:hypothetical protein